MHKTAANSEVLEFYREMPFNYMASAQSQANAIKKQNIVKAYYSVLEPVLKPGIRLLDVGCGTGWLGQTFAWHYKVDVIGIDFNPVAIERAKEAAALAQLNANFIVTDLFTYEPDAPFDVVTSLGVLHHTNDCIEGIRRCAQKFLAPGGTFFLGLYHAFGRKPFLDAFQQRKDARDSEESMLEYYATLRPNDKAEATFLRSWFRDQVLHPHETQHTLEEIAPVLEDCGLTIEATSINGFKPIGDKKELYAAEKAFLDIGKQKLSNSEYYPGFFVVMAKKKRV